jgi:hypothetical protein
MKKLALRVLGPVLAGMLVMMAGVGSAQADPAYPYEKQCAPVQQPRPEFTVQVCLNHQGFDYGAYYEWQASVTVHDVGTSGNFLSTQVSMYSPYGTFTGNKIVQVIQAGEWVTNGRTDRDVVPGGPGPSPSVQAHVITPLSDGYYDLYWRH